MTVKVKNANTNLNIKVPNWLVGNRIAFGILKFVIGSIFKIKPIYRVKFRVIKPFIKKAKQYKNFNIVSVITQNNDIIEVNL